MDNLTGRLFFCILGLLAKSTSERYKGKRFRKSTKKETLIILAKDIFYTMKHSDTFKRTKSKDEIEKERQVF